MGLDKSPVHVWSPVSNGRNFHHPVTALRDVMGLRPNFFPHPVTIFSVFPALVTAFDGIGKWLIQRNKLRKIPWFPPSSGQSEFGWFRASLLYLHLQRPRVDDRVR